MTPINEPVIGVDLGGTNLRVGLVRGGEIARTSVRPSRLTRHELASPAGLLAREIRAVADGETFAAVGLAVTGPVDVVGRRIENEATLPDWSGTQWPDQLEQELGVPVVLENDAVGAAIGEFEAGAGTASDVMAMVTLGTGIGVAVQARSTGIWRGTRGFHPEAGHIPVTRDDALCYCGLRGCWEMSCNGAGIRRRWTSPVGEIDWLGFGTDLAAGLRTVSRMFAPELIVIGGGIAKNYSDFMPAVLNAFASSDPMGAPGAPRFAQVMLAHPAIHGAAELARRRNERTSP